MMATRSTILTIILAASALCLPTDRVNLTDITTASTTTQSEGAESENGPKKVVTYILGQPSQDSVQSPAELLSPDRYEFYTFDDDGKIIKKLMNVEEIQRIIASSREGASTDIKPAGDYYQVLTVTPDVQSLPTVKLNPNEPLFSIHDVIASVQNVLKAEISQKMTQPPPAIVLEDAELKEEEQQHQVTSPPTTVPANLTLIEAENKTSSGPIETDKVDPLTIALSEYSPLNITSEKVVSAPTDAPTTASPKPSTTAASTEKPATTKKPTAPKKPVSTTVKITSTTKPTPSVSNLKLAVTEQSTLKTTTSAANATTTQVTEPSSKKPSMIVKVTSSVSQSSSPASHIPAVTTIRTTSTSKYVTTSTTTTQAPVQLTKIVVPEIKTNDINSVTAQPSAPTVATATPLSLFDAHPALSSNETYEKVPSFLDSIFTSEGQLFDNVTTLQNISDIAELNNFTAAETMLSQVQIPMNQDLAESVSSVISQIANEISLNVPNVDENERTTIVSITTTDNDVTETPPYSTTTEEIGTTSLPASWLKNAEDITIDESSDETTISTTEEALITTTELQQIKPQNKPRPFSKPPTEIETNDLDSTTRGYIAESRTDVAVTTEEDNIGTTVSTIIEEEPTSVREEKPSTTEETEKKNDAANSLQVIETNGNSSNIEIIQEAETGRIPRPTQRPEEITTRPSIITTSTTVPSTSINNKIDLSSSRTTTTTTTALPLSTSTETTENTPTTTDVPSEETSESDDKNSVEDAENISIAFLPMMIRTSTATPMEANKTLENLKVEPAEDSVESKIFAEELVEKSAPISSHKVILSTLTQGEIKTELKDPPPAATKQNYIRPSYVKPQKPVFVKPLKGKPQESLPSKPIKPALSSEEEQRPYETPLLSSPSALELDQAPDENLGLEATTLHLEPDVRDFVDLCNDLAFSLWSSITHNGLSFVRSVVVSPFAVTSLLAMVFLGARGPTSGQMNDILKLDDVVTFNPHLVFRNVTESLVIARHPGVATAAFVRELYSDRSKGKLLDFYKERAQQFYDGHVEEANFKAIGETLRRQTNHLVKRQTWGKVKDFLQGSTLMLRPPLAAFSANIFQADCSRSSIKDRDGEMYFVVLPSNRLRRLVPIPAAVWRDDFLAGYEPNLDATAAAVGSVGGIVSTIFVMPGQQGLIAPGDSLARLEHHLLGSSYKRGHWERLMRSLLRRPGLELQVPRFTHKSVVNVTASLQKMGLRDLFSAEKADLTGLNGLANDLHLSDMLQVNQFSTCGDDASIGQTHAEFYPATPLQRREKSADNIFAESIESLFAVSDFEDPSIAALPLELRPRQARIPSARQDGRAPEPPRLRLDRPFLFFVRHNPTGLILHVGRFNPRLMH